MVKHDLGVLCLVPPNKHVPLFVTYICRFPLSNVNQSIQSPSACDQDFGDNGTHPLLAESKGLPKHVPFYDGMMSPTNVSSQLQSNVPLQFYELILVKHSLFYILTLRRCGGVFFYLLQVQQLSLRSPSVAFTLDSTIQNNFNYTVDWWPYLYIGA